MSPDEHLAGLSVLAGLVVVEGPLSVDNALGITRVVGFILAPLEYLIEMVAGGGVPV